MSDTGRRYPASEPIGVLMPRDDGRLPPSTPELYGRFVLPEPIALGWSLLSVRHQS